MQSLPYQQTSGTPQDSKRQQRQASKGMNSKYDLINKNFIMPQQTISYQSNYTNSYPGHSNNRVKTDKITYPANEVIPKGQFEGGSSYTYDYINSKGVRGEAIKREGELKIGGKFDGRSKYVEDYYDKGSGSKQEKVTFPNN